MHAVQLEDEGMYYVTNRAGYYEAWVFGGSAPPSLEPPKRLPRNTADEALADMRKELSGRTDRPIAMVMFTPWDAKDPLMDRLPIYQQVPQKDGTVKTADDRRLCRSIEAEARKRMTVERVRASGVELPEGPAEQYIGAGLDAMVGMLCYARMPTHGLPGQGGGEQQAWADARADFDQLIRRVSGNRKVISSADYGLIMDAVLRRCVELRGMKVVDAAG